MSSSMSTPRSQQSPGGTRPQPRLSTCTSHVDPGTNDTGGSLCDAQ
ncbi:hypothetical protein ACH47B_36900 [Rhodococcus sp. NPDC019627]